MVQSCVVVGCTNRWEKGSKVSWHRIPNENNPVRRKQWLSAINRKNWNPNSQDRVCGKHFVSGSASQIPEDPDYAPSLYLGYPTHRSSTPNVKLNRFVRSRARQSLKLDREQDENNRQRAASILIDLSFSMNCTNVDADTESDLTPPRGCLDPDDSRCMEELEQMKSEKQSLLQELGHLQDEKRRL
ncbi:uncharacterized protein LOC123534193 [Mercenaria mercenaria]|uniref:uncharacterized protein LOC123534193 n=1 Tax=Mercenaria mercenaria TaxID=6596 RepID=UPI00234F0AE7|nr:uncharacterized protein LOC123534193 [Mercenaria mercenaria]